MNSAPGEDGERGVAPQRLVDDHVKVLHLLDGGVLGHLAPVLLVTPVHLVPQPVLDVGVGGQDVGDVPKGHPRRVVSGNEDDEGGGAERYDVNVLGLPPKSERELETG